jgi:hypothetical protein
VTRVRTQQLPTEDVEVTVQTLKTVVTFPYFSCLLLTNYLVPNKKFLSLVQPNNTNDYRISKNIYFSFKNEMYEKISAAEF